MTKQIKELQNRAIFPYNEFTNEHRMVAFSRFHGTTIVSETSRYKMSIVEVSKMSYKASLQIMNVQASDGGIYKAVAKNQNGDSTASINLNIAGSEEEDR